MANPSPRLENLIPFEAPDLEREGKHLAVRIDPDDKEWLKSQPEGMSYHVRRAIALYRQVIENPNLKQSLEEKHVVEPE